MKGEVLGSTPRSARAGYYLTRILAGLGVGLIAGSFWAGFYRVGGPFSELGLWAGIGILLAAVVLSGRYPKPNGISPDVRQSQWAVTLALLPLVAVMIGPLAGMELWQVVTEAKESGFSPLGLFIGIVLMYLAQLSWGWQRGAYDDELIRAYLGSAMSWGFVACVVAFTGLMLLVLAGAQVLITAIPVLFGLVLWVVGLRLWWLVRSADNV